MKRLGVLHPPAAHRGNMSALFALVLSVLLALAIGAVPEQPGANIIRTIAAERTVEASAVVKTVQAASAAGGPVSGWLGLMRTVWTGQSAVAGFVFADENGLVYGASDATASAVEEKAVSPEDLARTVFTLIGVDPDLELLAGGNRPLRIVRGGRVLRGVLT